MLEVIIIERQVLHCDLDAFYASVECLYNPAIRNKPVAVCGDEEQRHGIVLTKNYIAKKYGVQTGDALWLARQKCPDIVCVPANYQRYLTYSKLAKEIYSDYSNQIESFGLDENWIDVTGSTKLLGSAENIAKDIQSRVYSELGVTVSIGVSFNKVISKLGSDMNKPNGISIIDKPHFKEKVWSLPVGDLLYVGRATQRKLKNFGINTIGDLANTDTEWLYYKFGKIGLMLWNFANGNDNSPVSNIGARSMIKSVGNSTTTPRDLICDNDVKITLYSLAESVSERLRDYDLRCTTVQISIRDNCLASYERQQKLTHPSNATQDIFDAAYALYLKHHKAYNKLPIRSIGVRGCCLVYEKNIQLSLYPNIAKTQKQEQLDTALDQIRRRYGHFSVQRGIMLMDRELSNLDARSDHIIHPVGFLN